MTAKEAKQRLLNSCKLLTGEDPTSASLRNMYAADRISIPKIYSVVCDPMLYEILYNVDPLLPGTFAIYISVYLKSECRLDMLYTPEPTLDEELSHSWFNHIIPDVKGKLEKFYD